MSVICFYIKFYTIIPYDDVNCQGPLNKSIPGYVTAYALEAEMRYSYQQTHCIEYQFKKFLKIISRA